MFANLLLVSAAMSVLILAVLLLLPLLRRRYGAALRYALWLVISVRLLIPLRLELPAAPVQIEVSRPAVLEQRVVRTAEPAAETPEDVPQGDAVRQAVQPAVQADAPRRARRLSAAALVQGLWLFGALAFLAWHIGGYLLFRKRVRRCSTVLEPCGGVAVWRCALVEGPMLIGFFRPVVVLPDEVYTEREREAILRHELAHFRRGDLWYKLLLVAANGAHWFNPLVYVMARQARRDLEYACDETVVKNEGPEFRRVYAQAVLKCMKRRYQDA